jgi:uncharacterized membrane protein YheB (UPF0754 family)
MVALLPACKIAGFLLEKKKKEELEDYLHWLATEHMGLSDTDEARAHTKKVVDILFDHFEWIQKELIQSSTAQRP